MKALVISTINGVEILASPVKDGLVAIRPICEALNVEPSSQIKKIKEHPLYSSVVVLSTMTGSDKKRYEMVCLPVKKILGWLHTINPANVKPEARENLINYQEECEEAIYDHFFGKQGDYIESHQKTVLLIKEKEYLSNKKEKTVDDFNRYIDIEKQIKEENAKRSKITRKTVVQMRDMFEDQFKF